MYIKQIQLQNFQAIKEFSGEFGGNVYLVTGENELGKSTLLKAIMVLLTGNRDEVLRNGEDKGFAKIVVGGDGKEYEVKLSMTKANPRGSITITSKDTGLRSDRITALQDIFGYQDFDANEFASWSETAEGRRKQVQIVKSLLPTEIQQQITDIDLLVASLKEQRKADNAEVKTFASIYDNLAKGLKQSDFETYKSEIDVTELLRQQAQAVQLQEKAKMVRAKLAEREKTISKIPEILEAYEKSKQEAQAKRDDDRAQAKAEYENAIKEVEKRYHDKLFQIDADYDKAISRYTESQTEVKEKEADAIKRRDNCKQWLSDYEANQPKDISQQISDAQQHNEMHRKVAECLKAKDNLQAVQEKASAKTVKLAKLANNREALIKEAELPIDGLTFTEDGLELNGIPFVAGRVSDSQIMEVAAKLIIAKNPTVKVFRIARGESLGAKKLKALVDFAKKEGFQGFVEQVVRSQNELKVEQYNEK